MNLSPVKLLVSKIQHKEPSGDYAGQRVILLTSTQVLQALLDKALLDGYSSHVIESPGAQSGIEEIILEVVPEGASHSRTRYAGAVRYDAHNIVQVSTL